MPRVVRAHRELRGNGERIGARNLAHGIQHRSDIFSGIKRQRLGVLAVSAAAGLFGVFFLQMRGIGQQDVAQLDGRRVGVNGPAESVAHQARQIAGVIQVRMRQHAPVEGRRLLGQRIPVAQAQLLQPLE